MTGDKKAFQFSIIITFFLLLTGLWFLSSTEPVNAAEAVYEQVQISDAEKGEKVGKRYFKYKYSTGKWYVSTRKSKGYKAIAKTNDNIVTNGNTVYYVKNNKLYRFSCKSRKNVMLKKLPVKGDQWYTIGAVHKKRVYVNKCSFQQWKLWTYAYNTSTKKMKLVKSNYNITDQYGKNVIGRKEFRSDVSPYTLRICKLNNSGITKGKKLSVRGHSETYVGNKLYYVSYANDRMEKATLYKTSANGTNRKKIATFTSSDEYGELYITDITSKNCTVYMDGWTYKYIYATKRMIWMD